MASPRRSLPTNASGDLYVDDSCIDCGTCRWMAPRTFDRAQGASRVHTQPEAPAGVRRALQALVACPTASIGSRSKRPPPVGDFPVRVEDEVYHLGFHHEASYGAASWLIQRPAGNVMIDSPRFSRPLVRALEAMGGVDALFLTHRDDVADHEKFAAHFGCTRVMHADDRTGGTRGVERWIEGDDEAWLADDLLVIPTPGHTRGSACLLYRDRFLFTGDTLAWRTGGLYAFRGACWYDWGVLRASLGRLVDYRFGWVLPGHGAPVQMPEDEMREDLRRYVAEM